MRELAGTELVHFRQYPASSDVRSTSMNTLRERGTRHGHRGNDPDERRALLRSLNERVAESAKRRHFRTARVPFQCECAASDCEEFALHTLAEYEELRKAQPALLAPSHA